MWQFSLQLGWQWTPRLVILGSIYMLSACATLSKQECMVGDWQVIGYNDGVAGYAADRLASHTKACAKVSITPNYQLWERGRQLGLKQYCTVTSAYNVGRRGRKLNNVCPITMVNTLQIANQQGLDYYTLDSQLDKDKRLLEARKLEFDKLKDGEMLDFETEKEARARLISLPTELRDINRRINNTQKKLNALNQMSSD
ncbi:DUF2799 domain-containing protein [Psychrobacter sp. DAB_AL62B]|uniref:DUF2799 domain-containing protein n=1 Tax=Psychrobacter sp. DAB_AL62B TaxID=1028420 RepID=UPI0023814342|nr:DUF2799 domain-containing protein [Psychrobacter sp. DAB_AL62B]MDE4455511.1 DUF2799 domain-containing protein [Psychrobacter sp. DAB_AL62B]